MTCTLITTEANTFQLEGELCVFHAAELKSQLLNILRPNDETTLDLRGVGEVDTAGLQLLLLVKREAARQGSTVKFVNHSEPVIRAITLTNLASDFADAILLAEGRTEGGNCHGPE